MIVHKHVIRVRYADTDAMTFVYNGKYFEYFEVGRTELLRSLGLPYSVVEKNGYQLPVIEAGIKYYKPAFFDDLLEIESRYSLDNSPKVIIEYTIRRKETGEVTTEGFTKHLFINSQTKHTVRPPQFYVDIIRAAEEKNATK